MKKSGFFLVFLMVLVSCKMTGNYDVKQIESDTMFAKVSIDIPVFKNKNLGDLNKAVEKEMNSEFLSFNGDMKSLWLDWYAANQKFYPGKVTEPFEMSVKIEEIYEDKEIIVIVLKGYKDDGYPKKRDWQKTFTYTKSTGQVNHQLKEEIIKLK